MEACSWKFGLADIVAWKSWGDSRAMCHHDASQYGICRGSTALALGTVSYKSQHSSRTKKWVSARG
eukprot:1992652-Rhodomonas_salina.3